MIACQQPLSSYYNSNESTVYYYPTWHRAIYHVTITTTCFIPNTGKDIKGEYIDFTTILPKAMFEVPEPHSQSLALRLNPEGENYAIRPLSYQQQDPII